MGKVPHRIQGTVPHICADINVWWKPYPQHCSLHYGPLIFHIQHQQSDKQMQTIYVHIKGPGIETHWIQYTSYSKIYHGQNGHPFRQNIPFPGRKIAPRGSRNGHHANYNETRPAILHVTRREYQLYWRQFKSFMGNHFKACHRPASRKHIELYITYLHNNRRLTVTSIRPHLPLSLIITSSLGLTAPQIHFGHAIGYKMADFAVQTRKPITYNILLELLKSISSTPITRCGSHMYWALFLVMCFALMWSSEVCSNRCKQSVGYCPALRGFWSRFGGVCSLTYCNGNFRVTMVSEPFDVIL